MIQAPINIKDKSGSEFLFKSPKSDEAQFILDSMAEIAENSPYILSTPESFRSRNLEAQVKWIEDAEKSDTSIIIGVYDKSGHIVGFCNGSSYKDSKRKHRAVGVADAKRRNSDKSALCRKSDTSCFLPHGETCRNL